MEAQDIVHFWFDEIDHELWFKKDDDFDALIKERFESWLLMVIKGELAHWRESMIGRLAEVIILDQFSRNIYRNDARAFAQDPMALALAQEAVFLGLAKQLDVEKRRFLYMPYMHSESKLIHTHAVSLFEELDMPETLDYELRHKHIIDRFGRYPHRNEILARQSTPEELIFLTQPNSGF
ncbi:DUF924 family protein [Neisseria sp. Ec49-e6-T10]|uniref:DUF924 family protein n=1 Tax=Neisseria sp. Ec49-e6-T10 TaxID=3140744 RepID=UPI003EBD1C15